MLWWKYFEIMWKYSNKLFTFNLCKYVVRAGLYLTIPWAEWPTSSKNIFLVMITKYVMDSHMKLAPSLLAVLQLDNRQYTSNERLILYTIRHLTWQFATFFKKNKIHFGFANWKEKKWTHLSRSVYFKVFSSLAARCHNRR